MVENILLGILIPLAAIMAYIMTSLIIEISIPLVKYLKDGKIYGYKI